MSEFFNFLCDGNAIWKIARSNVHTGGLEILQAYLAPLKILPLKISAKCACKMRAWLRVYNFSMNMNRQLDDYKYLWLNLKSYYNQGTNKEYRSNLYA